MFFLIKFFNSLIFFPYHVITLVPYSFGNTLEDIRLGKEIAEKKNKKLVFIAPTIFPNLLKYKLASKFFLENVTVTKKNFNYILVKEFFNFILNIGFLFSRLYYLYYKRKFRNKSIFNFPAVGLENFYNYNKVDFDNIKKYKDFNLDFLIPNKFYKKSEDILTRLNVDRDAKIVCIHVRDSAFHNDKKRRTYRNSNIENYYETINYLLDKGYYIFRLGLIAEKKMQISRENFFDLPYLISSSEIEFLQFYLVEKCKFFIASESGPQYLPWFKYKPTLYTNVFKFFYLTSPNINCRYTLRKIFGKKNNKYLHLKEYLNLPYKYHDVNRYDDNFSFIENTSKELLESVIEFEINLLNDKWELTNSQIEFNNYLKNRLKDMYTNRDQNKYNDLAEQKYKILITKNTISNLGSATNVMINENFK
jgi:putative glycosyltransferase (TIGR04372 family)